MKHTLFIDPGIASDNGTGWATFLEHDNSPLAEKCGLVQAPPNLSLPRRCRYILHALLGKAPPPGGLFDEVVIEHMRVYPIARMKGDPNDLLDLAVLEGVLLTIPAAEYKLTPARDWKGQVPKNVMKPRIQRSLLELERTMVRDAIKGLNAKEAANVWDALGLGLNHYGRLR